MIQNYLTFTLDKLNYAVEISSVIEVLNFTTPTAIPCSDPYIEGLIYSREQGINVVNLRKRFNLPEKPIDKFTKVIVVEVAATRPGETEPHITLYGLVADTVHDVIQIDAESISSASKTNIPEEFVTAEFKYEDKTFYILNFYKLFENQIKETLSQQETADSPEPSEAPAQEENPS